MTSNTGRRAIKTLSILSIVSPPSDQKQLVARNLMQQVKELFNPILLAYEYEKVLFIESLKKKTVHEKIFITMGGENFYDTLGLTVSFPPGKKVGRMIDIIISYLFVPPHTDSLPDDPCIKAFATCDICGTEVLGYTSHVNYPMSDPNKSPRAIHSQQTLRMCNIIQIDLIWDKISSFLDKDNGEVFETLNSVNSLFRIISAANCIEYESQSHSQYQYQSSEWLQRLQTQHPYDLSYGCSYGPWFKNCVDEERKIPHFRRLPAKKGEYFLPCGRPECREQKKKKEIDLETKRKEEDTKRRKQERARKLAFEQQALRESRRYMALEKKRRDDYEDEYTDEHREAVMYIRYLPSCIRRNRGERCFNPCCN